MRLSADEDDSADDMGECPFCRAFIVDLADDVSDDDCVDADKAVASIHCPACNQRIALVREHTYRLAKFKVAAKTETK